MERDVVKHHRWLKLATVEPEESKIIGIIIINIFIFTIRYEQIVFSGL